MKLLYRLLELLFPPKCILCRDLLKQDETDLCRHCRTEVLQYPHELTGPEAASERHLHFLDSFTGIWYYDGSVRRSILRFKFYHAQHLAGAFGRLLAMRVLQDMPQDLDIITWAPVSLRRKLRRGYDQAELIARAVSAETGIPCQRLLRKRRHTKPQSGMNAAARRGNVTDVYAPVKQADISGRKELLVDDILTTGATADECALILKQAGAVWVGCAVIAVTPKKIQ